ncbi:MAG: twin-arginine translocase TatA/TatE family subunit [Gemmatimonadota bacterium]|nr:twin-arginine translocase TatA/TatE family subunit [Gemmatimonadota bacterium]
MPCRALFAVSRKRVVMPLSGIGFGEMLVIAMLVLIIFGPQRLPEITRSVGKAMREFKRGMNEIQRELEVADRQKRWGTDTGAAATAASHPAAAAAAAAATVPTAESADDPGTGSGTAAVGGHAPQGDGSGAEAASVAPTPEPVIAPPTFGSDLPEEIETQLAPPPTETAVMPSVPPEVETAASDAGSGSEEDGAENPDAPSVESETSDPEASPAD